jgi:hypothetical protein
MEFFALVVELIGHIAWPIAAVVAVMFAVRKLEGGFVQKLLPTGGSLKYGEAEIVVRTAVENAQEAVQDTEALIVEPLYAIDSPNNAEENLSPYELVMTAWDELASVVTEAAVRHDGYDDLRQVWSNLEVLNEADLITRKEFNAVRSLQQARNSIRRSQSVDDWSAKSYATNAHSLAQSLQKKLAA